MTNWGAKKFLQGLQCNLVARKINETLAVHAKKKPKKATSSKRKATAKLAHFGKQAI